MNPQSIEEPLFHVLSPRLMLSKFCAPGEQVTEQLEVNYLGWLQNPSPFEVRFDLEWKAGESGRTPREFPWLAGASGGGHDDLGVILGPRDPRAYIVHH